jgi:hypothetical protein
LRDSAESDLFASAAFAAPKEPKPPPALFAPPLPGAVSAERRLKDPKPPDFDDEDDDERCDENPLLKDDDELDGLASAGVEASGSISDSANTTCAYFEKGFSMVRSAVES